MVSCEDNTASLLTQNDKVNTNLGRTPSLPDDMKKYLIVWDLWLFYNSLVILEKLYEAYYRDRWTAQRRKVNPF